MDERAAAVRELRDAYLAGKLGAVCDAILTSAQAALGSRESLLDPLMFDAAELRAFTRQARSDPNAWVAGQSRRFVTGRGANKRWRACRVCANLIAPTNTRGRPRLTCDECSGRAQVA